MASSACDETALGQALTTVELADETRIAVATDALGNATLDLRDIEPNDALADDPHMTVSAGPYSANVTLARAPIYERWKNAVASRETRRNDPKGSAGIVRHRGQQRPNPKAHRGEAPPRARQAQDADPQDPSQEQVQALAQLDAWSRKNIVLSVITSPSVATCTNRVDVTVPCDGAAAYNKKMTFLQYTRIANKSAIELKCSLAGFESAVFAASVSGAQEVLREMAGNTLMVGAGKEINGLEVLPTSTDGEQAPRGGAVCYVAPEDIGTIAGEALEGKAVLVLVDNRRGTETYRYLVDNNLIKATADGTFRIVEHLAPDF